MYDVGKVYYLLESKKSYFFLNSYKIFLSVHLSYCDIKLFCFCNAGQNISRNMFHLFYDPVFACILLLSVISFGFLQKYTYSEGSIYFLPELRVCIRKDPMC